MGENEPATISHKAKRAEKGRERARVQEILFVIETIVKVVFMVECFPILLLLLLLFLPPS